MTPFEQKARELLDRAAKQFRYYETQHRNKTRIEIMDADQLKATLDKANINKVLAEEIETALNEQFLPDGAR